MPWCEECSRHYEPGELPPDGTCPHCGAFIVGPDDEHEAVDAKVPWHFWLLVVALVAYLGWRAVQLVEWLA